VASEAVGKHEVSENERWLNGVGWWMEKQMSSAFAHRNQTLEALVMCGAL
jgi:hypothetical protein